MMTLAEAIREGCKTTQQVAGIRHDGVGPGHGACVLGAAEEALIQAGILKEDCRNSGCALETVYPELWQEFTAEFPCMLHHDHYPSKETLNWAMATLNNECGWTREAIADWVEKLLPAKPALPVKP